MPTVGIRPQARSAIDNLVKNISRQTRQRLRAAERAAQEQHRRMLDEEVRRRRKREEEEQSQELGLKRCKLLTLAGFANLIACAQLPAIKTILRLRSETGHDEDPDFVFYSASRPSGDAWDTLGKKGGGTRDLVVRFYTDRVLISGGSWAADNEFLRIEVPFTASSDEQAELLEPVIGGAVRRDPIVAQGEQWEDEWDPRGLAGSLIMRCRKPHNLEKYLTLALTNYMCEA